MVYADRLPPHDIDAEDSVIGSILIDSETLPRITTFLKPTDFYTERNRWCKSRLIFQFDQVDLDGPLRLKSGSRTLSLILTQ